MVWTMLIISLAAAVLYEIQGEGEGPVVLSHYKFAMYKYGDIYGAFHPELNITFNKNLLKKPNSISAYILGPNDIGTKTDFLSNISAYCSNPAIAYHISSNTSSFIKRVDSTGIYTLYILICDKSYNYELSVSTLNPYGHLPGDLIMLLPFYAGISAIYLVLLIFWCITLCIFFDFSIPIQRYWIPTILVLCIIEHSLNFWYWELINITGSKSLAMLLITVATKALRDSLGRSLLMVAAKGWGISHETFTSDLYVIIISGIFYFVLDFAYETVMKTYPNSQLWLILLVSLPLIIMNTFIFYFVFAWFAQIFYRLKLLKQSYKLRLLKQFATILGLAGGISVCWTIVELLSRFFLRIDDTWGWSWLFIGIWDIIFLLLVLGLIVIWRINDKSIYLATSQQIHNDDEELSKEEEEEKYGIELGRIK